MGEVLTIIHETVTHYPIVSLVSIFLGGLSLGKLAKLARLPEITGLILAGILMGPFVLGLIPHSFRESGNVITEVALSIIALTIGSEFSLGKLKRLGKEVIIITIIQIIVTFGVVSLGLIILKLELPYALILGSISAATAPAATVAIVQSLGIRGQFVDYLFGVVALDDAGTVVLFGVVMALASGLLGNAISAPLLIAYAILEVLGSLLLGFVLGFITHALVKKKGRRETMLLALSLVLTCTTASLLLHLSPLLSNMTLGAVLISLSVENHRVFSTLEPLSPPIYSMFFVLAGSELDMEKLADPTTLLLGLVYILCRMIGKYGGVYLGSTLSSSPPEIKKWLGLSMFPQAGVAIGLVIVVGNSFDSIQYPLIGTITNVIMMSVFVNELIGPPLSKIAVVKGSGIKE